MGAAVVDVGAIMSVQRVPEDQDAVTGQLERDGAFDGFLGAVAGLADAEDGLDLEEGDLDRPTGRVAGDDLLWCRVRLGGDQCDAVTLGGLGFLAGLTDQDDPDGVGAPCALPQAGRLGDRDGAGGAVAGHRDGLPPC